MILERWICLLNLWIKNGHLLDPAAGRDEVCDLFIMDGTVAAVGSLSEKKKEKFFADAVTELDASGKCVMPGFVDLHVHLREPGFEYKETIRTGTRAAAKGGFTAVCPMPNTNPATDCPEMIRTVLEIAERDSPIHVYPVGAVTAGQLGKKMTDIAGMVKAGAKAISEDGKSVMDAGLYRMAMREAARLSIPVMAHCEDKNLVGQGAMNAGERAEELGIEGITNAVEDVIVARDILLAKETGAKLHLCHCSTKDSVDFIRAAKEEGLPVTGEVCPHHFTLTDADILSDDANYKMNPPLRGREDVDRLKEGLAEGIMDAISTDHAPHGAEEKERSIAKAPFGIVGSETVFSLAVTELVKTGLLNPLELVRKMSTNPCQILGVEGGSLQPGMPADITIADFDERYVIDREEFVSKGKNTPFHGRNVYGTIAYTIVAGTVVYPFEDGVQEGAC
jgi:dihydroorotase